MGLVTRRKSERERLRTFGLRIQHLRKTRGLSQEQLATKAGYSRAHMGFIEQGRISIPLLRLFRLADALNVKAEDLLRF